jgi:hypothetical protein
MGLKKKLPVADKQISVNGGGAAKQPGPGTSYFSGFGEEKAYE